MALVDCAPFIWPEPACIAGGGSAVNDKLINALNEAAGAVFVIKETGNIDRLGFWLQNVTLDAAAVVTCTIETVNSSDGMPSGTLHHANATTTVAGSAFAGGANEFMWWDFGADLGTVPVTRGDVVAIVLTLTTWTSGNLNMQALSVNQAARTSFPCTVLYTGSWAQDTLSKPIITIEYASAVYKNQTDIAALENFGNTNSTIDAGNRFQVPFPCRACGVHWWSARVDNDHRFAIMADDQIPGGTELAVTPTYLETLNQGADYYNATGYYFTTPVELSADTWYRVVYATNESADNTIIRWWEAPSNAALTQTLGTTNFYKTLDDGGGTPAWVDSTSHFISLFLVIDQVDDGAGGGGGGLIIHPGMNGGVNA